MRGDFARAGLSFERLPGIYGTELPPELKPYFCDSQGATASLITRGQVGCYASHPTAWMNIINRNLGPAALVCEDDIIFPEIMPELPDTLNATAPPGWDIIRLSAYNKKAVSPVASFYGGFKLVRCWKISVLADVGGDRLVNIRQSVSENRLPW